MSDTNDPTPNPAAEPAESPAETAKKRELRDFPARVFERTKTGWKLLPETYPTLTAAEEWVDKQGTPGRVYWPLKGPEKPSEVVARQTRAVEP